MLNLSKNRINKLTKNEDLETLRVLQTPKASKLLAKWVVGILALLFLIMFLPWQQNIRGNGMITALDPENRPQRVETIIAGRIEDWKVQEGQFVNRGDTIMVISEVKEKFFDPQQLNRLAKQIDAKARSIKAKERTAIALENQIKAQRDLLKFKLNQYANKVRQFEFKVQYDSINFEIAQNQLNRFKVLYDSGNISLNKFQDVELKFVESETKFLNARNDLAIALVELQSVEADALEKISKAESELEKIRSEVYEAEGSLEKLNIEYQNLSIRNQQYTIMAPQDGFVVKALKAGIGETIKEGEPVVTVMPERQDNAVELYIKAMDVPLLAIGREVRLEFDGWPALQFSGWPAVAVGTFGGRIQVIDYVDSKNGEYRILVTPDPNQEPWPEQLRMGSGVYGWAMLDEVPIWYEIWRQLNGFPPSLRDQPGNEEEADTELDVLVKK
ncbi:MAG: HlyD family secretion protein [Cyclobacteriaceae bacterium]